MEGTSRVERANQIRQKIEGSPLRGLCFLISRRWWTELLAYFGWSTPDNDYSSRILH